MSRLHSNLLSKSRLTLLILVLAFLAIFTADRNSFINKSPNLTAKKAQPHLANPSTTSPVYTNSSLFDPKIKSEITYPILVKQQLQIEDLQKKYDKLEEKLKNANLKNHLSELILSFVDLEKSISSGKPYQRSLERLEVLSEPDAILVKKIAELKILLEKDIKTPEELSEEFESLIPKIINKKPQVGASFFDQLKYNLTKSISIRKINGEVTKPSERIDLIILKTQESIKKQQYDQSCIFLSSAPEEYKPIVNEFHVKITNVINLNQKISEIFSYLKELNNV